MGGYQTTVNAAKALDLIETDSHTRFTARCPAHEDRRASLSVAEGSGGRALLHCFAGCEFPAIVAAMGLTIEQVYGGEAESYDTAEYVYVDEKGAPLIKVVRSWPKTFRQFRWDAGDKMWKPRLFDTRRVLYDLPAVARAASVWMVEGEKDAENLARELADDDTLAATTLLGGAGGWRDEYGEMLRGKRVDIIADRDPAGQEGALKVRNGLRGVARARVWLPPEGYKDISEMLAAGLGVGDLEALELDQEIFQPMDWDTYEVEHVEWLLEPYVPRQGRVMAFGPAGSLKSLWAMWAAVRLAREGHRVAYFSLEMSPREVSRRLKKFDPPKDRFRLFRKLSFDSELDLAAAIDLLQGYSMIVVDSWSAVTQESNSNDAIAKLDRDFFMPLMEDTGATLLVLDNTGQAMMTDRGAKVMPDWARGASAKGDKMDVTLLFELDETNNRKATVKVKKMRYDKTKPKPLTILAKDDDEQGVDFRVLDQNDVDLGSLWRRGEDGLETDLPPVPDAPPGPTALIDRLRIERDKARLKEDEVG